MDQGKSHLIRKKTKKCALKIHWQLKKEGTLNSPTNYRQDFEKENLVHKYRVKKDFIQIHQSTRDKPGELVEIDVKYVPGRVENKRYYQYTAIDTASRWRHLAVYSTKKSNFHSVVFLKM